MSSLYRNKARKQAHKHNWRNLASYTNGHDVTLLRLLLTISFTFLTWLSECLHLNNFNTFVANVSFAKWKFNKIIFPASSFLPLPLFFPLLSFVCADYSYHGRCAICLALLYASPHRPLLEGKVWLKVDSHRHTSIVVFLIIEILPSIVVNQQHTSSLSRKEEEEEERPQLWDWRSQATTTAAAALRPFFVLSPNPWLFFLCKSWMKAMGEKVVSVAYHCLSSGIREFLVAESTSVWRWCFPQDPMFPFSSCTYKALLLCN